MIWYLASLFILRLHHLWCIIVFVNLNGFMWEKRDLFLGSFESTQTIKHVILVCSRVKMGHSYKLVYDTVFSYYAMYAYGQPAIKETVGRDPELAKKLWDFSVN